MTTLGLRLKFFLLTVALVLIPVCFGVYIQYEARSWWLSAPLGRLGYEYYMFGAIFLFAVDISVIVLVFQLLDKQW